MDFNKQKQALLYLDRTGFYFYEHGFEKIISLGFQETSVKDLEVIDDKSLERQIQIFINQYKLRPSNITIVISPNIIFEKNILTVDPTQQKEAILKFTNTVPFNNVATSTYPIEGGAKAIGLNEDLYLAIKNSFEKVGFTVNLVLPYHSLGQNASLLQKFTIENLSDLLKKVDRLRDKNLLHVRMTDVVIENTNSTAPQANTQATGISKKLKITKRALIMGVVFLVLIAILIYMLLNYS